MRIAGQTARPIGLKFLWTLIGGLVAGGRYRLKKIPQGTPSTSASVYYYIPNFLKISNPDLQTKTQIGRKKIIGKRELEIFLLYHNTIS